MLTPDMLARILRDPFPRIEINGSRTMLVSSRQLLPIPDLNDPIALVDRLLAMSDEERRNYYVARLRMRWPRVDLVDICMLENLMAARSS